MILDTYDAYLEFQAIKLHFNSKTYDYFKFHGKTRANWNSFTRNNAKRIFTKLANKYKDDYVDYIAYCFYVESNITWIGACITDELEEGYYKHAKYMQALKKSFSGDLDGLIVVMKENNLRFRDLFIPKDKKTLPIIEKIRIQGLISVETSVIMNKLLKWTNRVECSDPLWIDIENELNSYDPFIKCDLRELTKILKIKLN
jgi:hypothetical protein